MCLGCKAVLKLETPEVEGGGALRVSERLYLPSFTFLSQDERKGFLFRLILMTIFV